MTDLTKKAQQRRLIRELQENQDDAFKLADCFNEWREGDSWGGSFGLAEWTADKILKDFFKIKALKRYVIDEDGVIQGYCSLDEQWEDKDTYYVSLLGVRPSQQRRGFGTSLLLESLDRTIADGKKRLELYTWPGNTRSVPTYKKTGFMWRPSTSVLMENYLPGILSTELFKDFFEKNNWLKCRRFTFEQKPDEFKYLEMDCYEYTFIQDDNNYLKVYIDRNAKEICGFEYSIDGRKLAVQLILDKHEIFLGLDRPRGVLKIFNGFIRPIEIKGEFLPFDTSLMVIKDTNEIVTTVKPNSEEIITFEAKISSEITTYVPKLRPEKRTEARFRLPLLIDGKKIELGCGWVPKEALSISIITPTLYGDGDESKTSPVVIAISNISTSPFNGTLIINGDGLKQNEKQIRLDLYANDSIEETIDIDTSAFNNAIVLEWKMTFSFDGESNDSFPVTTKHLAYFPYKHGVTGYQNGQKEVIIENSKIRCHFDIEVAKELFKISLRDYGEFFIRGFSVAIGKPFPEESSEFWLEKTPYEIFNYDNRVLLRQVFLSKKEKPGLKVTRWIELTEVDKALKFWYELENTSNQSLEDVAILYVCSWFHDPEFSGVLLLPLKKGWLTVQDREFDDFTDYPKKVSEFRESWLAKLPDNQQLGFGLVWNKEEFEDISIGIDEGPYLETKSFSLAPGQKIVTGHVNFLIGSSIAKKTRTAWLRQTSVPIPLDVPRYGFSFFNYYLGERVTTPDRDDESLTNINWVDDSNDKVPLSIFYYGYRKTGISIKGNLSGQLWKSKKQWETTVSKMNNHQVLEIPTDNYILSKSRIVRVDGTASLPFTNRFFSNLLVAYNKDVTVTLEEKDDYWIFSNQLLTFKTSPRYGASLFSLTYGSESNEELFFSRYPNKKSFVWYKTFVGGVHPFLKLEEEWTWHSFLNNDWNGPITVAMNEWKGIQYKLPSPSNNPKLDKLETIVQYMTRPKSPLLWIRVTVTNRSKITKKLLMGIGNFFQPIEKMFIKTKFGIIERVKNDKKLNFKCHKPYNWFALTIESTDTTIVAFVPDPFVNISGESTNANNYSNALIHRKIKLKPDQSQSIDLYLFVTNGNPQRIVDFFCQNERYIINV